MEKQLIDIQLDLLQSRYIRYEDILRFKKELELEELIALPRNFKKNGIWRRYRSFEMPVGVNTHRAYVYVSEKEMLIIHGEFVSGEYSYLLIKGLFD